MARPSANAAVTRIECGWRRWLSVIVSGWTLIAPTMDGGSAAWIEPQNECRTTAAMMKLRCIRRRHFVCGVLSFVLRVGRKDFDNDRHIFALYIDRCVGNHLPRGEEPDALNFAGGRVRGEFEFELEVGRSGLHRHFGSCDAGG